MSNTPIQITTELSKALEQINQKLDKIDERLGTLEFRRATMKPRPRLRSFNCRNIRWICQTIWLYW
jgi:hypothetical protein